MLQYLLHSTVPLTYANDISHNLSSTVHIRHVKWHLCITAGRKVDWLNDWVFDWWKVSDVLPFAIAIILLPSISLILSPLTYCITLSPTPLNQAAALPLPSSSIGTRSSTLLGFFWTFPYACNCLVFISSETRNYDTSVAFTLYVI
jgi:hypothetical protein